MESWLLDVKRVRIPRPKFAGAGARRPREPPKDYYGCEEARGGAAAAAAVAEQQHRALAAATEELRRAVQDKL